jgi:hypothetical protein
MPVDADPVMRCISKPSLNLDGCVACGHHFFGKGSQMPTREEMHRHAYEAGLQAVRDLASGKMKRIRRRIRIAPKKGQEMAASKVTQVAVDHETLELAMALTGIEDPTELVEFALRLLTAPDPAAAFARKSRGSLPGFDLDV